MMIVTSVRVERRRVIKCGEIRERLTYHYTQGGPARAGLGQPSAVSAKFRAEIG